MRLAGFPLQQGAQVLPKQLQLTDFLADFI
jgi:hypothetical protein